MKKLILVCGLLVSLLSCNNDSQLEKEIAKIDIDVNVDDHNLSSELDKTYKYEKTPIPFKGMQDLKDCLYLGGDYNKKLN